VTKKSERERKSKRFKVKDERSNANERYHAIPQDLLFINALLYLFCEECEKGRAVAWDESEGMYYHTNTRHKCEASQIREQVALLFGKALAKDRFIGKLSQPSCGYCGERNPLKPRTVKTSKGIFCNGACQKDSENYDKVLAKRVLNGEGE